MSSTYSSLRGRGSRTTTLPVAKASWGITSGNARNRSNIAKENGPFGAMMADEIFQTYDYYETEECQGEGIFSVQKELPTEEEFWYQTDLPLQSKSELEDQLRSQIEHFKRAHRKMYMYALQWHYLMEEVEDSEQVSKMFRDMQMIRKLTGSEAV